MLIKGLRITYKINFCQTWLFCDSPSADKSNIYQVHLGAKICLFKSITLKKSCLWNQSSKKRIRNATGPALETARCINYNLIYGTRGNFSRRSFLFSCSQKMYCLSHQLPLLIFEKVDFSSQSGSNWQSKAIDCLKFQKLWQIEQFKAQWLCF